MCSIQLSCFRLVIVVVAATCLLTAGIKRYVTWLCVLWDQGNVIPHPIHLALVLVFEFISHLELVSIASEKRRKCPISTGHLKQLTQ